MRHWPYLLSAIVHEVAPTLSLRASFGHVLWIAVVVIGYAGAFACLAVMMRLGALIGVVYAIWAAVARTGPIVWRLRATVPGHVESDEPVSFEQLLIL